MFSEVRQRTIRYAICCFALVASLVPAAAAQTDSYRLDNGMEVILKESHGSPMISSVIFVRSGAKYESPYENGITHFLEHLLFDGTVNLTRLELDKAITELGGYINAFTRKDGTVYLVLLPKQYIDYGMTVQADMLFNSVFPPGELAKERKVVIEEIRRDADSPNADADAFCIDKTLGGTDYGRPVLGYKSFIDNIPRHAIVDYWKRYYRPGNMTALIIGDFDSKAMKQRVAAVFGSIPDTLPVTSSAPKAPCPPADPPVVAVYDTLARMTVTLINVSVEAPAINDSAFYAFDLLSQVLDMDDVSPLKAAVMGGDSPLATETGVSLTPYDGFSRLDISIETNHPESAHKIIDTVIAQLRALNSFVASPETVEGIKTGVKTEDIYYSEKLHYYAFIIAPQMLTGGWDFVQSYADHLNDVTWSDCQQAARTWLSAPSYIATVVRPTTDSMQVPYEPTSMNPSEVVAYFDTAAIPEYDLSVGYPLTYPATDSVKLTIEDNAAYHREVLGNGLTVIVKSSPDSKVFAMNILGKNRTLSEPEGKEGITDFVNHMIEKGTVTRDASELSRDLAKIGANVTLYDNPWIPYDDRYTTRRFSFMKFETIEEFAPRGFHLFSEMILSPAFDSTEIEGVRRSLMGSLGRATGSAREIAQQLFYESLFEGQPYARPIAGTPRSIGGITAADLREHHHRFYDPSNMIMAIGTSRPIDEIMGWVQEEFGSRCGDTARASIMTATPPKPLLENRVAHTDLESEQTTIYLGGPLPGANDKDAVAIDVAATVLSTRLYRNLREVQGLAYSVGAGAGFDRDFGYFYSVIGTGSENYQKAIDGIILEIDKLKLDGPTLDELNGARNSIWGHLASARLSRINQAYYLAVDEYLGRDLEYDQTFVDKLAAVTPDDIRRVVARYFPTNGYVLASAGKKE